MPPRSPLTTAQQLERVLRERARLRLEGNTRLRHIAATIALHHTGTAGQCVLCSEAAPCLTVRTLRGE